MTMIKLTTFLMFFVAAFFVPAWPLLLFIGLIYLLALVTPRNGGPPSDREGGSNDLPTYKPGANAMELADPFSPQSTPKHSFQTNP
jgi:hypothetical protein